MEDRRMENNNNDGRLRVKGSVVYLYWGMTVLKY